MEILPILAFQTVLETPFSKKKEDGTATYHQGTYGIFGQFHYQNRPSVIDSKTGHKKSFRCNLDFWLFGVMGITGIPTPYLAPNANAHLERWNRSLRAEALNHFIFLGQAHLHKVVKRYVAYYNRVRLSQAIRAIPDPYPELDRPRPSHGKVVAIPVLGGFRIPRTAASAPPPLSY